MVKLGLRIGSHRGSRLWRGACVLLMILACRTPMETVKETDLPVESSTSGTQEVDADLAFEAARNHVRERLPEAYFVGMSLVAPCDDLWRLEGTLSFSFLQVRRVLLEEEIIEATALVDTVKQRMDVLFQDLSHAAVRREPDPFWGDRGLRDIANLAQRRITSLGISPCTASLTQLSSGWRVHCRQPPPVDRERPDCRFEIVDGKIVPPHRFLNVQGNIVRN
jgi:hypothetical protein